MDQISKHPITCVTSRYRKFLRLLKQFLKLVLLILEVIKKIADLI